MRDYEVVIAGAGPAGLAAARRAVESGACTLIVDDNPQPGGQIWRARGNALSPEAVRLLTSCQRMAGARVFDAPGPGRLAIERPDGTATEITYRSLILATGARELFLPFPGWTLPNVMGAGGLQALAKGGLPIEGKNVVVAGCGPLLLAVGKYMREHGARVRLIAEQASHPAVIGFGLGLASHPAKFLQAMRLRAALFGIRYLTSCWPIAAHPDGVTLRRRDRTWTEPCDFLACGFGLIPNLELPLLLGCRTTGGAVWVDDNQQTSVPGIYAAGEATGIGGLDLALVEGEIAGLAATRRAEEARTLYPARATHRQFAEALNRAFALRPELKRLAQPETIFCRCEDVSLARVDSCSGFREAKLHTRCGMGPCQGRICGGAAEFLFGWRNESVRPPLFPARIRSLMSEDVPQGKV